MTIQIKVRLDKHKHDRQGYILQHNDLIIYLCYQLLLLTSKLQVNQKHPKLAQCIPIYVEYEETIIKLIKYKNYNCFDTNS